MEESIKELTMAAFDRFSDMPEHIVHHIMSFLPTTSATRVSALSKNFNSAWLSYPVFDFDHALYEEVIRRSGDRTSCEKSDFLDFVLDSLKKHRPSNTYMQRFSLRVWPQDISDNRIQNSIRLAVDRNVNELVVEIQGLQNNYFRLARTLALQNDELVVEMEENDELFVETEGLENNYCSFPRTVLQNAKSLSVLKLLGFSLELEDLIPCLNLVENLSLESCSVSANFMLSSDKLTDLNLRFCEGLDKIEIDALNLQSFSYTACHIEQRPCEINLSRCKNLKSLTIEGSTISDDWVKDHISKLVLLRNLKLVACRNLQKFEIVGLNLQSFSYTAYDIEQHPCEINLSCKNLKSLTIEGSTISDDWVRDHISKLVLLRNLKLVACRNLQKFEIVGLNLQSFSYTAYDIEQHPCEINLSCKNLKSLTIEKSNITDDWVKDHVSKLVLLRNLKLVACKNLQKIKISNRQLGSFQLLGCEKLLKAKIEAPNLISFDYSGKILDTTSPPKIILLCSTLAHVKLSLTTTRKLTSSSFLNLRSLLTRFGHCKTLSLSLQSDQELIFPKKVREYSINPLLDLRHMRVELWSLSSLTGLVDSLLWLAPNLKTMFISVEAALESEPLMLDLQFHKWRPRRENQMIKKVILVKYEGHDDDKKSLLSFFHEKAITVEVNSDH